MGEQVAQIDGSELYRPGHNYKVMATYLDGNPRVEFYEFPATLTVAEVDAINEYWTADGSKPLIRDSADVARDIAEELNNKPNLTQKLSNLVRNLLNS